MGKLKYASTTSSEKPPADQTGERRFWEPEPKYVGLCIGGPHDTAMMAYTKPTFKVPALATLDGHAARRFLTPGAGRVTEQTVLNGEYRHNGLNWIWHD